MLGHQAISENAVATSTWYTPAAVSAVVFRRQFSAYGARVGTRQVIEALLLLLWLLGG